MDCGPHSARWLDRVPRPISPRLIGGPVTSSRWRRSNRPRMRPLRAPVVGKESSWILVCHTVRLGMVSGIGFANGPPLVAAYTRGQILGCPPSGIERNNFDRLRGFSEAVPDRLCKASRPRACLNRSQGDADRGGETEEGWMLIDRPMVPGDSHGTSCSGQRRARSIQKSSAKRLRCLAGAIASSCVLSFGLILLRSSSF